MHRSIKRPDQRFWSGLTIALKVPIMLIAFILILTTIVRFPPLTVTIEPSGADVGFRLGGETVTPFYESYLMSSSFST
ncbi:MAG: hypothetical protein ACK8QZ_09920 [Anaerolineales bacterium]